MMSFEDLNGPQATFVIGLLSLVSGFAGAEVAPDNLIERLLWPQRSNNGFGAQSTLKHAFFLPAGGPLYRVVVKAMDNFFKHSLHKGTGRGHMLGTAFFPDTGIAYKLHPGNGQPTEEEFVRNGLVVRILKSIPYISFESSDDQSGARVRQNITVSHLELFNFETSPPQEGAIPIDDDTVGTRTILALLASELPAIISASCVWTLWGSFASLLFLVPLGLKLLAALTTIEREDLIIPHDEKSFWNESTARPKFEIHVPGEGFQVISGPAELVLPFFRHYGHPIRCRWREVTQMLIVGATGLCYPLTLIIMAIFAPLPVFAVWTAYQFYVTLAMVVVRYGDGELWSTTEERIGRALVRSEEGNAGGVVVLKNRAGERMGMRLKRTVHGSYTAGKARVAKILEG